MPGKLLKSLLHERRFNHEARARLDQTPRGKVVDGARCHIAAGSFPAPSAPTASSCNSGPLHHYPFANPRRRRLAPPPRHVARVVQIGRCIETERAGASHKTFFCRHRDRLPHAAGSPHAVTVRSCRLRNQRLGSHYRGRFSKPQQVRRYRCASRVRPRVSAVWEESRRSAGQSAGGASAPRPVPAWAGQGAGHHELGSACGARQAGALPRKDRRGSSHPCRDLLPHIGACHSRPARGQAPLPVLPPCRRAEFGSPGPRQSEMDPGPWVSPRS